MIETARGLAAVDDICAVPGVAGIYVGPADLAISMGYRLTDAFTHPDVCAAMGRIHAAARTAGLVSGVHAGSGGIGKIMAGMGFRMITLASESQALRRGAGAHLGEATAAEVTISDGYLQ